MRIVFPRSELKEAVAGLGRVISRHSSLPILEGIKFSTKDGLLNATATDLDQTVCYSFAVAEIAKAGAFVVNCEALKPFAKGKDEDQLILEESKDEVAITNTIAGHSITERLAKFDAQEWPIEPPAVETKSVDGKFMDYFRKAIPFVSSDSSRAMLNTVNLNVSGKDHCIVATDGRRLTCFNSMTLPIKVDCNLKPTKFLTWSKLTGDIEIGAKKIKETGTVWFALRNQRWVYQARSLDGTFPNWRQIMPSEPGAHVVKFAEVDVQMLAKVFPWFAGNDQSKNPVTIVGKDERITIHGYNKENSTWSTLELKESSYTGKSSLVTLDRHYLLDALLGGFRTITFADNHSPVCSDDGQGGRHVLMPITPMTPNGVVVEDGQAVATQVAEVVDQVTNTPAEQAQPAVETISVPETKTKKEARQMPEETKTETALDKILVAFDAAKAKLSEAKTAMFEIAEAVKAAVREQKNQRNELDNARVLLGKLQAVKL